MVIALHCILIAFLFAGHIAVSGTAEQDTVPESVSAQEIVRRAVARAEAQHNAQADVQFQSQTAMSIQSLDAGGKVTRTESTQYRQYPVNGALFEEVIARDGRALNARERKDEEKNKKKFIREIEKRKQRGLHPQPEKRPGIRFGDQLMRRYRYKMLRSEDIDRHRCWVIAFEPKEGELPVDEMMDHALNQSTGTLWVAQDDYGLVRLDFVMSKPFKYWAGLLAVIRNTEGRLDFHRVEPNLWMPVHFDLKLDLNVMMVKNIRRHIIKKWTDYTRIDPTVASGK
ncbi:MAG: hypothetical protein JXA73_23845 [Acidobacteria bacterium]|nr:hypothetical protein [Acidobacteriota bacterium]